MESVFDKLKLHLKSQTYFITRRTKWREGGGMMDWPEGDDEIVTTILILFLKGIFLPFQIRWVLWESRVAIVGITPDATPLPMHSARVSRQKSSRASTTARERRWGECRRVSEADMS